MAKTQKDMLTDKAVLREAKHLQALEGNPLDPEQEAMFDDMLSKGMSHEECLAHITERAMQRAVLSAAE